VGDGIKRLKKVRFTSAAFAHTSAAD